VVHFCKLVQQRLLGTIRVVYAMMHGGMEAIEFNLSLGEPLFMAMEHFNIIVYWGIIDTIQFIERLILRIY